MARRRLLDLNPAAALRAGRAGPLRRLRTEQIDLLYQHRVDTAPPPDGFIVADQVLNATSCTGVLLAHRPGFVVPSATLTSSAVVAAAYMTRTAASELIGSSVPCKPRIG